MKRIYSLLCVSMLWAAMLSCQEQEASKNEISPDVIGRLQAAGFDTSEGLKRSGDGYIVEYDIFLSDHDVQNLSAAVSASKNATEEHYRTYNLVTGTPRTLKVYMDPGFDSYMQTSFDKALARYNAEGLVLSFQRTTNSADANIKVLTMYEQPSGGFVTLGRSAGFPSASGQPASPIQLNTYVYNGSSQRADATTVIAHEIGHAIGLRHTDYMSRRFSCGSGGNEGSAGVGAVYIPGTPKKGEAGSYMLACSDGTDRAFTSGDKTALKTVY
jgi:hypothetical protein